MHLGNDFFYVQIYMNIVLGAWWLDHVIPIGGEILIHAIQLLTLLLPSIQDLYVEL